MADDGGVGGEPGEHQEQHRPVLAGHQRDDGKEVGDNIDHHVHAAGSNSAHGQRRLHHLRRDTAGKLVLIKTETLPQQVVVHPPAHRHRHVAHNHLVTRDSADEIAQRQQHQHHECHAGKTPAFLLQQRVGRARAEPVDDVADKAEQQHFQHGHADACQHDDDERCIKTATVITDKGKEPLRRRLRPVGREWRRALFDFGKHENLGGEESWGL